MRNDQIKVILIACCAILGVRLQARFYVSLIEASGPKWTDSGRCHDLHRALGGRGRWGTTGTNSCHCQVIYIIPFYFLSVNLTRKNAWSTIPTSQERLPADACPDPRNPVRQNENETKERGLMVLKGLKLSHPSQTVSRPRRLPCARPQNSFKHPAGRANLSETN